MTIFLWIRIGSCLLLHGGPPPLELSSIGPTRWCLDELSQPQSNCSIVARGLECPLEVGRSGKRFCAGGWGLGWFARQHDVHDLGDGRILLFDNGNGGPEARSRALELELDTVAWTAENAWQFEHPDQVYAGAQGSAIRLDNGNTLIAWGTAGTPEFGTRVTEVTQEGQISMEVRLPPVPTCIGPGSTRGHGDRVRHRFCSECLKFSMVVGGRALLVWCGLRRRFMDRCGWRLQRLGCHSLSWRT